MDLYFSISLSIAIQPADDPVSRTTLADIYKEGGPLDSDILACKIGFQDCSDVLPDKWFERKVSHQGNCFKINPNGNYNASIAGHLGGMSLFLHAQNKQYSLVSIFLINFLMTLSSTEKCSMKMV